MAPSRGLSLLNRAAPSIEKICARHHSGLARLVADSNRKGQVYISRSLDPYINLSIEHFLLQKSHSDSTILFLYTNRPCIVIGRNQNPWVEANLGLLNREDKLLGKAEINHVSLVRRRSGGGTVFHDEGNVNYSVIFPTASFDRDKHAQMVVRALHRLGVNKAQVNERHDIVVDGDAPLGEHKQQLLKVSGSAYKLTRLRSLHHGTCLLSSPNINLISKYLKSPAKPYIKARGVDSVSSPISNVNVPNKAFEDAVIAQFSSMYDSIEPVILTDEATEIPDIAKGLAEMRSLEWTYLQTPQFTFSSHLTTDGPGQRPASPKYLHEEVALSFTARNGTIMEAKLAIDDRASSSSNIEKTLDVSFMIQKQVHAIKDWQEVLPNTLDENNFGISRWLNELFGKETGNLRKD